MVKINRDYLEKEKQRVADLKNKINNEIPRINELRKELGLVHNTNTKEE
jgi:hypothetical protein